MTDKKNAEVPAKNIIFLNLYLKQYFDFFTVTRKAQVQLFHISNMKTRCKKLPAFSKNCIHLEYVSCMFNQNTVLSFIFSCCLLLKYSPSLEQLPI